MILLSATGITKAYGVNTILADVSFHINNGDRIGIIGANGAGKTTLLSILSGELPFESGDLFLPSDVTVGYLRQQDDFVSDRTVYEQILSIFSDLMTMEEDLHNLAALISRRSEQGDDVSDLLHRYDDMSTVFRDRNGYGYRSEIRGILNSMAFPETSFEKKISSLSGGERTRLALASLLLQKPDLLLLDEPTNHLDIGTLKWLEQYLRGYTGTLILISHDRYFLDQTVNRVFEVEDHRLSVYEGNYTSYLEKKRMRQEDALRHYEHQQKEIRRQEEIIRRFKQHGTEKLAKRAQSREKRLEHVERRERPSGAKDKMKLHFKENYPSGSDVIFAQDLSKSFSGKNGKQQLFEDVNFDIKRGERICIVGANGIGKTTLLKIIMDLLPPDTGFVRMGHNVEYGYYDQQQQLLNVGSTVLEELHDSYRLYSETVLRGLLGRFLFQKDDVFKQVSALSGGEKARLSLLKLMLSGANLLIMDEPTNHLDIASKEVFEDALLDYPGTVLLVSHDRYLLNKVPTQIFELTENGMKSYLGKYDYYMEKKLSLASGKSYLKTLETLTSARSAGHVEESAIERAGKIGKEQRQEERRLEKEQEANRRRKERRLAACEEEISRLEQEIALLEQEMCREDLLSDYEALTQKGLELAAFKTSLDEEYQHWLNLQ